MKARLTALSSAASAAALLAVGPALGAGTTIDWGSAARVAGGRVLPGQAPGGLAALRVTSAKQRGKTVPLAVLDRPGVAAPGYALVGQVRYAGVEGNGYLELWSVFSDGSRYFSRTLARRGADLARDVTAPRRS